MCDPGLGKLRSSLSCLCHLAWLQHECKVIRPVAVWIRKDCTTLTLRQLVNQKRHLIESLQYVQGLEALSEWQANDMLAYPTFHVGQTGNQ